MADIRLSTRAWVAAIATAIACIVALALMGGPEPALPRCPADRVSHVRCEP